MEDKPHEEINYFSDFFFKGTNRAIIIRIELKITTTSFKKILADLLAFKWTASSRRTYEIVFRRSIVFPNRIAFVLQLQDAVLLRTVAWICMHLMDLNFILIHIYFNLNLIFCQFWHKRINVTSPSRPLDIWWWYVSAEKSFNSWLSTFSCVEKSDCIIARICKKIEKNDSTFNK